MAVLVSLITFDIWHWQTFCSYFSSLNSHKNRFRLLLLVLYNNNEIEEQNQIKSIKSSLGLTRLNTLYVRRELAGPISASKRYEHII